MKKIVITLLILLALAPCALADTIYLRDGRVLRGTVLGFLNGRVVVRLATANQANTSTADGSLPPSQATTAGAASGEVRFFRPAEIDRIEIEGRSLDEARFIVRNVQVQLGPDWIDSGVDVRRGQRVQVKANGTIYANRLRITPDGLRTTDPAAPLPRAAEGLLIGAVGNDPDTPIVELGSSREFTATRTRAAPTTPRSGRSGRSRSAARTRRATATTTTTTIRTTPTILTRTRTAARRPRPCARACRTTAPAVPVTTPTHATARRARSRSRCPALRAAPTPGSISARATALR
jgi:hypothetical protein